MLQEKNQRLQAARGQLRDAGFYVWRVFMTRPRLITVCIVLANRLARAKGDPSRAYNEYRCALESACRYAKAIHDRDRDMPHGMGEHAVPHYKVEEDISQDPVQGMDE